MSIEIKELKIKMTVSQHKQVNVTGGTGMSKGEEERLIRKIASQVIDHVNRKSER
ncbi:DUF5908 family protein [Reichenbachiella sp. 5M10]|uniref:DUF5908 family protein n=1 Tax=Reichenbachiella sp. 5M10 TaxID=1889772 RepID=UPI00130439D6|nr:DUF5908 family protein [Reichenbachiella sp. 5M10]